MNYEPNQVLVEAEQFVLGCALTDWEETAKVELLPEHFYYYGRYWEAIMDVVKGGSIPDLVSVLDMLSKKNKLEDGDYTFLAQIIMSAVTSANVLYYSDIIKSEYRRRESMKILWSALKQAHDGDVDGAYITTQAMLKVKDTDIPFSEVFTEEDYNRIANSKRWTSSSLHRLTYYVPVIRGENIYIAGQTSTGKTQIALNLAFDFLEQGANIGYFSMELGREQLFIRIINWELNTRGDFSLSDIDIRKRNWWDTGIACLSQEKWKRFHFFNDIYTLEELASTVEARKFDVIFVDYIQLMSYPSIKAGNRTEELGYIARELRRISQKRAVIVLSQFNRGVKGDEKEIDMSRIRESGKIEETATGVVLLRRDKEENNKFYYAVAKNQTYGKLTNGWRTMILQPNGRFKEE